MPRKYEKVRELLPIIKELSSQGKTQQQIAEKLGLADKKVVWNLLYGERQKKYRVFQNPEVENLQKHCKNISMRTNA